MALLNKNKSSFHVLKENICGLLKMLNKNTLGVKKVRGQSEATMVI